MNLSGVFDLKGRLVQECNVGNSMLCVWSLRLRGVELDSDVGQYVVGVVEREGGTERGESSLGFDPDQYSITNKPCQYIQHCYHPIRL
jgi:hypothetical protein